MMTKLYRKLLRVFVILFLSGAATLAYAQKQIVTGVITDQAGQGMPGVNVLLKGTTVGVTTDSDGNFSIEAGADDVLVFSFIGYKTQEVPVGSQTKFKVALSEDVETLQEVVVVGYGEMRRADMSAAQTSIKAADLQKTVNTTIEQAIQGRAAGVYVTQNSGQPGGGISVNIRGISTINGATDPLYVIDGVQIQSTTNVNYGSTSSTNPLAGINPADIESVEILQGPNATAIYGSRGTNGVVLITTKRGRAGETKITYDFLYSNQQTPKTLPVMNLSEYARMVGEIYTYQGREIPTEYSNPSLLGDGTNWQKALFKTAALQKHQIGVSGGSEKTTFYLSGEYFNQDGIAIGSSFKRGSVRLNLDNQTRKWLKLSTNLNFNQTNEGISATQESVISNALALAPNIPVKNPDGTWGGADATNGSSVQFTPLNPVAISSLIQNNLKRNGFLGGFNVEVTPVKGLLVKSSMNTNIGSSRQDYFIPTYRLGDKINNTANLSVTSANTFYWNWNQLIQYNFKLGNHDFGVMASHEAQKSTWKNLSASKSGFVTNSIPDLEIGDDKTATAGGGQSIWGMESYLGRLNYNYKDKYYIQGAFRADGSVNFGANNKWGYFPSVSAAWRITQEPFMQSLSFINELKLRLETGVTGNQGGTSYYGPLKSYSTQWGSGFLLSRYGNDNLKWEETKTNNIGFNISVLENRIQLEGDFYIKKTDNLLMTAPLPDYLGTNGEGSITPPPINVGSMQNKGWAFSLTTINIDRGGLKWTSNFNISGFKAKVTKFYSQTAFIDRTPWYVGDTGSGNNWDQRSSIGQAPWLFQGYLYDGLFQSVADATNSPRPVDNSGNKYPVDPNNIYVGDIKYKDLNGDGIIDVNDRTNIGNPWPKFILGFSNTISYKGFDLSILITGVYGNDVYNLLRYNNTNPNNINLGRNLMSEALGYAKVVQDDNGEAHLSNPDAYIPRIGSNVNGNRLRFTDQFVEDGSYIRFKNVSLTYHVPTSFLNRQSVVHGARVTVGAQNLFTLTHYKGYDPEVGAYVGQNASSTDQSIGLDYGRYPLTRVYTFSIGFDF